MGETKRKLKVREKEHRTETEKVNNGTRYIQETERDNPKTEIWGSAITDHTMKENHVIDWDSAKIVERERDDQARGVKEAVYMRILPNMNRDEGCHHLFHLYDDLLGATARTEVGKGEHTIFMSQYTA